MKKYRIYLDYANIELKESGNFKFYPSNITYSPTIYFEEVVTAKTSKTIVGMRVNYWTGADELKALYNTYKNSNTRKNPVKRPHFILEVKDDETIAKAFERQKDKLVKSYKSKVGLPKLTKNSIAIVDWSNRKGYIIPRNFKIMDKSKVQIFQTSALNYLTMFKHGQYYREASTTTPGDPSKLDFDDVIPVFRSLVKRAQSNLDKIEKMKEEAKLKKKKEESIPISRETYLKLKKHFEKN